MNVGGNVVTGQKWMWHLSEWLTLWEKAIMNATSCSMVGQFYEKVRYKPDSWVTGQIYYLLTESIMDVTRNVRLLGNILWNDDDDELCATYHCVCVTWSYHCLWHMHLSIQLL